MYKYIFVILPLIFTSSVITENSTTICPFTKIIEDIFKIQNNKTSKDITLKDYERTKIFLNSIAKVTVNEETIDKEEENKLVNDIIASINRIKSNLTLEKPSESKLNEAIILNVPIENKDKINNAETETKPNVKIDDKIHYEEIDQIDIRTPMTKHDENTNKMVAVEQKDDQVEKINKTDATTNTKRVNYVEILTIEPNNTQNHNSTANNIIEVLKHLMPIFNNSLVKQHNITLVERNHFKNNPFGNKNISTIIVTFCENNNTQDIENANEVNSEKDTKLKVDSTDTKEGTEKLVNVNKETDLLTNAEDTEYDYSDPDAEYVEINYDDSADMNLTVGEKRDILEAANYGMQKMHELYSVLEPKLYSMGLWLEDQNPARFVAAFNAPAEDIARYTRYGYASLQASTKLKELTSGTSEDGFQSRGEDVQFPSASALRQSPLLQHCPLRGVPKCPPASKRYRTHDGTCNNFNRPRWGSTMTPVQRFLPPSYSDGLQAPRRSVTGTPLPSAREISSMVHEDHYIENPSITHLLMQWGQFLDHDVTSSSQTRGFNGSVPRCCKDGGRDFIPKDLMHPECMPIAVPPSDPFYGPRGVRCLDFIRSSPAPHEDCALGWREQLNQVSAYIDGSPIYASSPRQSDKLRLFRNGMLQYGRVQQGRPPSPQQAEELCRRGAVSTDCFRSGDARVNEHPGLVAAHIVWLKQHNRMAQELAHLNPQWSDEKIYQETRKIVGAMIQHITYREFLPIVLGPEVMRLFDLELQKKGYYRGYDPKINASPASSFGSAAFRFGHSLVQPSMMRFDRFHRPMSNNVSLHAELTNPSNIWSVGAVDRLILGMMNQPIQTRDEFITEELTNHLFQTPSFNFGMDLAAINIQRGRDHGIPSYTEWREPCGLSAIQNFGDLFKVMPARVVRKLQSLYRHVDDIDLFTGGIAERPVVGGLVGPTFACIIAQQFSNLRKGDRFWYENGGFESSFTPAQLQQIRRISFAQVLCRTLDSLDTIQPFVFLSSDNVENGRISCQNGLLNDFDLSPWIEINSQFDNNISKNDDVTKAPITQTQRPRRTKPTTTTQKTTIKHGLDIAAADSNWITQKKPAPANLIQTDKVTNRLNKTDTTPKDEDNGTDILTLTIPNIDDKLDFKNKSSRLEDETQNDSRNNRPPTKQYHDDYDEEDNVQSVQSVVINNLPYKRPYHHNNRPNNYRPNRPVMTVTENVNKYTYLINYVPRPTESWRHTTRRPIDRDVVKVTYQTYDDTYRRPNKPYYYNRQESGDYYRPIENKDTYDENYRRDRPNNDRNDDFHSSARSNDDSATQKPIATVDKIDNTHLATENPYKLVTFGYVGSYRGDLLDEKTKVTERTKSESEALSKEFLTNDNMNDDDKTMKLSTFFFYETATKPYNFDRPTRRNDDVKNSNENVKTKYYYVKNVLHKYPDDYSYDKPTIDTTDKPESRESPSNPDSHEIPYEDVEDRSVADKLDFPDEAERQHSWKIRNKIHIPVKRKPSPAKTPSVSFQVIPSENSPSQWAVYDEKEDLPEALPHRMPPMKTDPYALKELPRPLFASFRRRKPSRS